MDKRVFPNFDGVKFTYSWWEKILLLVAPTTEYRETRIDLKKHKKITYVCVMKRMFGKTYIMKCWEE